MSDQKLSTEEILAQIRGGGASPPKPEAATADAPAESPEPAAEAPQESASDAPAKPAAPAPSGTASILASIKGGGAGGAAAKPKAAAPSGTGSILDSIRGGGGGAKPAAAAKPAAEKKKSVDTSKAAGMSAADMIAAARQGIVTADPVTGEEKPAAKKPVALPKKPLKPVAKPKAKEQETRRSALAQIAEFALSPIVIAWTSLCAATAAAGLGIAKFMMPESGALIEPPTRFKIGPPTDYGAGSVSTKWKAQFGIWIVNDEIDGQQMIYALSTVCTHLGCTPNWLEGEQKFKCPCHGSGFYKTGINFEGPAPRPLERHGIRLAEDGMLEVDKSVKFQRELGQWDIAASYVPV